MERDMKASIFRDPGRVPNQIKQVSPKSDISVLIPTLLI